MERLHTPSGSFATLAAGDPGAPLVLCLHGFPDHARTFEDLLVALAAAGYHAVAPWLRGYAPSTLDGPFHLERIATDALELGQALSPGRPFFLVGHDWGAAATYAACALAPERVARAVAMAVPHPAAFALNLVRQPSQLRRSWYMFFFQLRGVADRACAHDDFALVRRLWRDWSPGYQPPADFRAELEACLRASWPAPLEYYRAALRTPPRRALFRRIRVPVLTLFGAEDGCIAPSVARGQERFFAVPPRVEVLPGAGHFLHLESPARVAKHVTGWLSLAPWPATAPATKPLPPL